MSDNLKLYNAVRSVPAEAQKKINGGRLKGMTDINPMWRIKTLTEQFGVCGVGWKYEIVNQWYEATPLVNDGELTAHVKINLYIKVDGQWSDPIPGIGGSMLVAKESKSMYVDDECYKKALTDAISVACKALGVGADVYWEKDKTKYDKRGSGKDKEGKDGTETTKAPTRDKVFDLCKKQGVEWQVLREMYNVPADWREKPDSFWEPILKEMEK